MNTSLRKFLFHLVSASNEHSYVVRFAAKDPQRTLWAPELGTFVNPVELLYFRHMNNWNWPRINLK